MKFQFMALENVQINTMLFKRGDLITTIKGRVRTFSSINRAYNWKRNNVGIKFPICIITIE